jgi:VanZ family protein
MKRVARLAAPVALMTVLWLLSSIPAAPDQTMAGVFVPKVLQKVMHVIAYGVLGAAWVWAFDFGRLVAAAGLWAFSLSTGYAAVDEVHQTFVPGRYGSPWDVALDAVGVVLALALIAAARRWTGPEIAR